ncbi:rRNA maturation RNase YbeY [Flavobacterium croceum]|uniref:Endoribonuclease YbeY n=1 Tax=Flavobacterium croceum DSM 17960 TaxID=1121886 RepID=A0A2S4NBE6_9FLAO|nr:rRNA maturation RNase YbeY [Flavobacterium croceum]POS03005.1 rRNA maturation RNase YbeY [Flavobacterium croceum DSM 17960]
MISYNYECDFKISNEDAYSHWITSVLKSEVKEEGEISYIFCDDEYLLNVNKQYLEHDYYTDVISFDYTIGNEISGDIFISIERVLDNAKTYNVSFENELQRVIIHGVLHFCGYKDKTETDETLMRNKEEEKIKMFHVEQS